MLNPIEEEIVRETLEDSEPPAYEPPAIPEVKLPPALNDRLDSNLTISLVANSKPCRLAQPRKMFSKVMPPPPPSLVSSPSSQQPSILTSRTEDSLASGRDTETQNLITESQPKSQVRFNLDNSKYRKRHGHCLYCLWTHWVIIAVVILLLALITILITWGITKAQYSDPTLNVPTDMVVRGFVEISTSRSAKFRTVPIRKRDLSVRNTLVHPLQEWSAAESQNWCLAGHSVCEELWKSKSPLSASNCSSDHSAKLFQSDLQTVMNAEIIERGAVCRDENCRQMQVCCLSHTEGRISFTFALHISRTSEFPAAKADNLQYQLSLAVPSIMDELALVQSFEWLKVDKLRLCLLQLNLHSPGFDDCLALSKCREMSQN